MTPVSRMGKGGAQKKERKNKRGVLGGVKALKATTKVCFVGAGPGADRLGEGPRRRPARSLGKLTTSVWPSGPHVLSQENG